MKNAIADFEGARDPKDYTVGILMNMIDAIVNRGLYPERLREIIEAMSWRERLDYEGQLSGLIIIIAGIVLIKIFIYY